MAERVLDVVAEDPQVQHVAGDVEQPAVQEHRREDRERPAPGITRGAQCPVSRHGTAPNSMTNAVARAGPARPARATPDRYLACATTSAKAIEARKVAHKNSVGPHRLVGATRLRAERTAAEAPSVLPWTEVHAFRHAILVYGRAWSGEL